MKSTNLLVALSDGAIFGARTFRQSFAEPFSLFPSCQNGPRGISERITFCPPATPPSTGSISLASAGSVARPGFDGEHDTVQTCHALRRLTAIIEREDDGYVALCPEYGIASELARSTSATRSLTNSGFAPLTPSLSGKLTRNSLAGYFIADPSTRPARRSRCALPWRKSTRSGRRTVPTGRG